MKKISISLLLWSLVALQQVFAQGGYFTLGTSSPMLMPSLAGITDNPRFNMQFRDMNVNVPGVMRHTAVSFDTYLSGIRSGIGAMVSYENMSALGNLRVGAQYNYRIKLNDKLNLVPALQFEYFRRTLAFDKLIFGDQTTLDGTSPNTIEPRTLDSRGGLDASTSLMLYAEKFWVGAAVDHLFLPDVSLKGTDNKLKPSLLVSGGYNHVLKGSGTDQTSINFVLSQALGKFDTRTQFTTMFNYRWFMLGGGVRVVYFLANPEIADFIACTGFRVWYLNIGYAFEYSTSYGGGSNEILISYDFGNFRKP